MKEADIDFGSVYAIKSGYSNPRPGRVIEKAPVEPGKKRSRTYVIEMLDANDYREHHDASSILYPWSQYEDSFAAAQQTVNVVENETAARVREAVENFTENLEFYLHARFEDRVSTAVRVPYGYVGRASSAQDIVDEVMASSIISIPLSEYVALIPDEEAFMIPPTDSLDAAIESRQVSLRAITASTVKKAVDATKGVMTQTGPESDEQYEAMRFLVYLDEEDMTDEVADFLVELVEKQNPHSLYSWREDVNRRAQRGEYGDDLCNRITTAYLNTVP